MALSTRPAAPAPRARGAAGSTALRPERAGAQRLHLMGAFVVAVIVGAVCIHAHAMWFDELQAWNIARASHSLPDLFRHLRYEGHPALWYLPLYGLTRINGDPRTMQMLGWLIVVAVDAVVLFRSPFPVGARIALVAGYFFAFEYSVITRSYGLGVLLLVLALVWLGRPQPAWGKAAVTLALLAWTSLAGAVLAGVLALVLAWRWWSRRGNAADGRAPIGLAIAAVVSGIASVVSCIPPPDFHSFSLGIPNSSSAYVDPERFGAALGGPWRGLVPIPVGVGRWNTNVIDQLSSTVWLQAVVSVALVVLVARVLRPYRFAFTVWLLGVVAYVVFSVIVVLPDREHYAGEFFLLFMVCAWLAYAPPGAVGSDVPPTVVGTSWTAGLPAVLLLVVAAQIVATVAILPRATIQPFAPDRTLAEVAARAGLARDVVSGQDFDGVTMAGYLDRPVWSIARHTPMRYFVNDEREARGNEGLTPGRLVCSAAAVAHGRGRPVALVVDKPMPTPAGVRLLLEAQGSLLYRVAPHADVASVCT